MIRSIIIEDEKLSRDLLRTVVEKFTPDVTVCAECADAKSGIAAIRNYKPDLVFLDIEMPDGTGLDVIKEFKGEDFCVIIITAYEHYAIDAFHLSVVDYLLKPLDINYFMNAIEKVKEELGRREAERKYNDFVKNLEPKDTTPNKKIVLSTSDNMIVVDEEDIVHCESDNYYTVFHFKDGSNLMITKTLKDVEEMLEGRGFTRTHKSHLVNNRYITGFAKDSMELVLSDGTKIPVSRRKKEKIVELIRNL